ncbi:MAG: PqqD family protein [bacterium]
MPFKRKQDPLSRKQLLAACVLRNPVIEWETNDKGFIVLTIPRRSVGFWTFVGGFMKVPDTHEVELDRIGTVVWDMCDGKTSVEAISKRICEVFKMSRLEAEMSLGDYLKQISKRGFVAVLVPKK